MLQFAIKNFNNEIKSFIPSSDFTVTSIDGLTPPKANINTTSGAFMDGSIFNSAAAKNRNIVVNLAVESPAEANRLKLYKAAPIKQPCTVYINTASRSVSILGYVEACEVESFSLKTMAQISIICPSPWFVGTAAQTVNISATAASFTNAGDIPAGAEFTLTAAADAPLVSVENGLGQFFEVDYTFLSGDVVTINTSRGLKNVILKRGSTYTNLINYVAAGSTWLQIDGGSNSLKTNANISGTAVFLPLYSGV